MKILLTSHDTAYAEIVADTALLIDPRSTKNITDAILCIMREPKLRGHLKQEGLVRAKQFTWKESTLERLTQENSYSKSEIARVKAALSGNSLNLFSRSLTCQRI